MINCYFCSQPLEHFRDEDDNGNYENHYACYNCPDIIDSVDLEIWKRPCSVIMHDQIMSVSYLYLPNIEKWVSTFYWEPGFTDIKNKYGIYIVRVNTAPDIFNTPIDALENKIKTWITFS